MIRRMFATRQGAMSFVAVLFVGLGVVLDRVLPVVVGIVFRAV